MVSIDGELDRVDSLVARRRFRLREHVIAVVQARACEDVAVLAQCDRFRPAVCQLLLECELRAGQCIAVLVYLVHVELVGEGDDVVPGGLVGAVRVARVVAVMQTRRVDVAVRANLSIGVQRSSEVDLDRRAVESFSDGHSLLTIVFAPTCAHGELMFAVWGNDAVPCDLRLFVVFDQDNLLDFLKCERSLHLVLKCDAVALVTAHVTGQSGSQLEGDLVADIVIGAVLPVAALTGSVISIHDLLFEARDVGLVVGEARLTFFSYIFAGPARHNNNGDHVVVGNGLAARRFDQRGAVGGRRLGDGVIARREACDLHIAIAADRCGIAVNGRRRHDAVCDGDDHRLGDLIGLVS